MAYSLALGKIKPDQYKEILKTQYLLPSRKILRHDIDGSFAAIISAGIDNLEQLKKALATPQKIVEFAAKSRLSADYLTILKREIGSLEPKAVLLKEFPGIDAQTLAALHNIGITSSKDYYELFATQGAGPVAQKLAVAEAAAQALYCLCDLVRINGVGAVAAKSFLDAGYRSAYEVAESSAEEMLARVSEVNNINHYYKTKLTAQDMQFCIDFAKLTKSLETACADAR